MLESYGNRLQEVTPMKIVLGRHGDDIRPGTIYLAPGDFHMTVTHDGRSLQLDHGPLENFIRPAADPLFRSLARAFKERCVAVILTGMGKDGTLGAGYVAASGGTVIAEDPTTATIPSMPKNVIEVRIASRVEPLQRVGRAIEEELVKLASHCCA
jgi:two-component system chemotaxis response regulator CheB